jgi:hypothetical protein
VLLQLLRHQFLKLIDLMEVDYPTLLHVEPSISSERYQEQLGIPPLSRDQDVYELPKLIPSSGRELRIYYDPQ